MVKLTPKMCDKIAGINNKTADWDEDLRPAHFKGGKNAGKLEKLDRKEEDRRQKQRQKDISRRLTALSMSEK